MPRLTPPWFSAALALSQSAALILLLAVVPALAQSQSSALGPRAPGKASMATSSTSAAATRTTVPPPGVVKRETGPSWAELSTEQQAALRPLANSWSGLSADRKRKWIAIARNHANLSPEERTRLHSRMSAWAALSPAERAQARLNYAGSRELSAQDKHAQWQAYQALPADKKRALARQQPVNPAGASVAATSAPGRKLVAQPEPGMEQPPPAAGQRRPKPKLVSGDKVDSNTLLPQQPPEAPTKRRS